MINIQKILLNAENTFKKINPEKEKKFLLQELYEHIYHDIKEASGFDGRMVVDIYKKIQESVSDYLSTPTQNNWHLALFNDFYLHIFQNLVATPEFKNYIDNGQLSSRYVSHFSTKLTMLYHEGYMNQLDMIFSNSNTQVNSTFPIQFEGGLKKLGELTQYDYLEKFLQLFLKSQKKQLKIDTYHGNDYYWNNIKNTLLKIIKQENLYNFYQNYNYIDLRKSFHLTEMTSLETLKTFVEFSYKNDYDLDTKKTQEYRKELVLLHKNNKEILKSLEKYPETSLTELFSHLKNDDYRDVIEGMKYLFKGKLVKSLFIEAIEKNDTQNLNQITNAFEKEVQLYLSQKDKYYHYLGLTLEQDNEILFNILIKANYKFDSLKLTENTQNLLYKDLSLTEVQKKTLSIYFDNAISHHTSNDILFLIIYLDKPKMLQSIETHFEQMKENLNLILPFLKEQVSPQMLENNLSYNKVLLENTLSSSNTTPKKKQKI